MKIAGTLRRRDLEGGFWQLDADDGKHYTLLGARGDLKDGARVEVEGSLEEGFGIAMAGPQLKVGKVRRI